jgi:hypothetical protein
MLQNKAEFKKLKQQTIPIVKEIIEIIKDMALVVPKKYDESRMSPFRELCLGYLLISKNNIEAALRLLENGLVHQIHYINRNMFELVVTLFYIDDNSRNTEARVQRYFEYNDAVINHKAREMLRKYQNLYKKELPKEIQEELEQKYRNFIEKYKKEDGKKPNEQSWSGLNLFELIGELTDKTVKERLLTHYQIVVSINNSFLHPTIAHIRSALGDFYSGEIDERIGILQIRTIVFLVGLMMDKFLLHFQKGRPAFRSRIDEVEKKLNELDALWNELTSYRDRTA